MRRGTRVGQAYVQGTFDGEGMNEEIVDSVEAAGPGVEKAGEDHGERYQEGFHESFFSKMRAKFGKQLSKELDAGMTEAGGKGGDRAGDTFVDRVTSKVKSQRAKISQSIESSFEGVGERIGNSIAEAVSSRLSEALADARNQEQQQSRGVSRNRRGGGLGDRIGGLFGAGSRNNVLNLLGKSLGNVINLTQRATNAAGGMFSAFSKGFTQAAEGAGFFQKVMSGFSSLGAQGGGGLAKVFSSLAAAGPAAAVAVLAVVVAISALVSIMGALLAIATAVVATITGALVGAFAVLGGAMSAIVAAGGLLVAAFMSMTDAQKTMLKEAFQPLRAEMVGIGQIMIKEMVPAFSTWSANLQKALMLAVPVAQVMGKAFAEAGNTLTASFSGPGFQAFANSLGVWLPSIVQRLSLALGSFLNGTLGLFAALMPYVNRFAGYLAQVAERFSVWANSAAGQNAIASFMDRALMSLQSLWNAVRGFSGFIAEVLFSPDAMGAGNTIFDSLARTFEDFRAKVAAAAANGDLKKWFDDAIVFGSTLWDVMLSLGSAFMAFYNSGVLQAIGVGFEIIAYSIEQASVPISWLVDALGGVMSTSLQMWGDLLGWVGDLLSWVGDKLSSFSSMHMNIPLGPLQSLANAIGKVGDLAGWAWDKVSGLLGMGGGGSKGGGGGSLFGGLTSTIKSLASGASRAANRPKMDMGGLIRSGNTALSQTTAKGAAPAYKNPYEDYANSLIKDGPSIAAQIKSAMKMLNKAVARAITEAAQSDDLAGARSALTEQYKALRAQGKSLVDAAQSALNNAAQSLASASSPGAAAKALNEVKKAQKALGKAQQAQGKLNAAANILAEQKVVDNDFVNQMVAGGRRSGATLAEFALARERLAVKIDAANQKLSAAIAMRDQYAASVTDASKAFGALTTAQASTIDGIEQALTYTDITSNLQDRLTKIKKFNDNLRVLLAQGLSQDAYKQIVDAGVEGGSAYADALVAGGGGAIQQVNDLVSQINGISSQLGTTASNQLYGAGVSAAKGLVDGLTSLSAQLDSAATKLGNSIAKSIKKALGIKSPSTVLRAMMDDVGDGAALGLDDQHVKVGAAGKRLSDQIAVSPEVAAYAAKQGQSATVSGNGDQRPIDLTIVTPTEDPHAVATEVINELVERL